MEQQNSRMVAEVNKLIANALIKESGVFLPNLGSLSVEAKAPEAKAKGAMVGPSRVITFTTEEKHRPLMVIIAEYGNCTPNQAAQIYDKWLEAVKKGDEANIEAIGKIEGGAFVAAPEMLARLNPAAKSPMASGATGVPRKAVTAAKGAPTAPKPKREKTQGEGGNNNMLYMLLGAAAIAVVGYFLFSGEKKSQEMQQEVVVVQEVDAEAAERAAREAEILRKAQERAAAQQRQDQATQQSQKSLVAEAKEMRAEAERNRPAPTGIKSPTKVDYLISDRAKNLHPDVARKVVDGVIERNANAPKKRYFVVYGVYSSKLNAGRMVVDIMERTQGQGVACGVHLRNGSQYMITVFESDSYSESNDFLNGKSKGFTDNKLWILDTHKAE